MWGKTNFKYFHKNKQNKLYQTWINQSERYLVYPFQQYSLVVGIDGVYGVRGRTSVKNNNFALGNLVLVLW